MAGRDEGARDAAAPTAATRIAAGRARVVREVRAAAPLMAGLAAPVTARGPWLTAVLNVGAAHRFSGRPVAVVVEPHRRGCPDAVAFLHLRRHGAVTVVTLLGDGTGPVPGGRPPARLLARDEESAGLLAAGVEELLRSRRGPWRLRLAGLPMGDRTARHLAARLLDSRIGNARSSVLVDALDQLGPVIRSRDPRVVERWLPVLLDRASPRPGEFLRAAARLHAAGGQLELAVVPDGDGLRAGLLTLLDGGDRWPWWGFAEPAGLPTAPGAALVALTAPARGWPPVPGLRRRGAGR